MEAFDDAVMIATDESFFISPDGLPFAYDLLLHLSNGGTIENHESMTPESSVVFLATIYNTTRQMVQIHQEFGEHLKDDDEDS